MAKKKTHDEKIIAALDALDKGKRMLENFGALYDEYMDNAALHGNDAKAKQLIRQKHRVYVLADQLDTIKNSIKLGAYTSQAMAQLGKLPEAIAACNGLLRETPDFGKLEKSLRGVFRDIDKTEGELAKLTEMLEPEPEDTIESRLMGTPASKDESTDWFKAEYAAMVERVKGKVAPESVDRSASEQETGDIDYEGIIEDEKKK